MKRREFLTVAAAAAGMAGCKSVSLFNGESGIKFGVCRPFADAALLKSVGFDFIECVAAEAFIPGEKGDKWKRRRDELLASPLPLRACNGFIPGNFRLTGPKADFAPALDYAELVLRRAEEAGVKAIVFGSGGARNVPGDICSPDWNSRPDTEAGSAQFVDFCKKLSRRVADLKQVQVVIEPLRPKESNIINFVWQGADICRDINSPRIQLLADIFHMMMGGEKAKSIVEADGLIRHCHIANYSSRTLPGIEPEAVARFRPYFDALRAVGYNGGVSCECVGMGEKQGLAKELELALSTLKSL